MPKSTGSRSSRAAWEYELFAFSMGADQDDIEKHLNDRGKKGWEIVSVVPRRLGDHVSPGALVAVFKRPA